MNYDELKSTNLAFASKVWRNMGLSAPITVMFECFKTAEMSAQQRMISRGLGNQLLNRSTCLVNYTEDNFNAAFGDYTIPANEIVESYSNAIELNISVSEIYGEDLILRRVDTTDTALVTDEDGKLKPQWSIKKTRDGQELTHEGALIYSTVEFAEPGMTNATLKQDQNLSRSITRMTVNPIEEIKENKVKATQEVF